MFILKLSKKDLQFLPLYYSEMFSSCCAVRDNIEFNEDVNDVFKYCLFNNPNIVNENKLLKWSHFIQAGITHIKDICYEVIPGFLPESCIVEIIQDQNSEISSRDIRKDYCCQLCQKNGNISFVIICMRKENLFQYFFYVLKNQILIFNCAQPKCFINC